MPAMTFESTLPMGAAELQRASAFRREMDAEQSYSDDDRVTTRLSSLNPSLHQDLLRFEQKGRQSELLEVMAGAVRHSHAVTAYLQLRDHVLALTVLGLTMGGAASDSVSRISVPHFGQRWCVGSSVRNAS